MPISNKNISIKSVKHSHFDIAIIGAGCGGLTLAKQISVFTTGSIAIIDKNTQRPNHFWGFWDDGNETLELARSISRKSWQRWSICSHETKVVHKGCNSTYRIVSSERFESLILGDILKNRKIKRFASNVDKVDKNFLNTSLYLSDGQKITAKKTFDSRPLNYPNGILLQHFLGLTIQSDTDVFDPLTAILMDFRVTQEEGIHFIYLLPFSERTALIESTVISEFPKELNWYENEIQKYLIQYFNCSSFSVQDIERGVIPMGLPESAESMGIPIGLRAGALRSSSGYAFAQIQAQIWDLSQKLYKNSQPTAKPGCDKFEKVMDTIFLKVLNRYPANAPEIFVKILESLSGDEFASFMAGYSKWPLRLRLIWNLPKGIFIRGLIN